MKIIETPLKTAKIDREIAESGWILTIFLKILRGTTLLAREILSGEMRFFVHVILDVIHHSSQTLASVSA